MMEKKKSKAPIIVILIVLAILIAAAVIYFVKFRGASVGSKPKGKLCYVESVEMLVGGGYIGGETRFMGVVESQESKSVQKDSGKTVKEIFVKVGDNVIEGDELFIYDTQEMELQLEQLRLDLQAINNRITSYSASINDLSKQRNSATTEDERLSLTSQINSYNASLNEEYYNQSVKQLEIERQQEAIESAVVYAPMSGVIKNINESSNDSYGYGSGSESDGFITIMADGDFRVKGTVTEQNIYSINAGMPVIIYSRVSDEIWKGEVTKIDLEPQQQNNNYYYYDSGMGDSASKYSFYVTPEDTEGLILGQHLYLELDYGQGDIKEGLYLPSYYIFYDDEMNTFVWRQEGDHITKAAVAIGEYDESRDAYLIETGLSMEDYIAFPDGTIEEGNPTTTNYDDILEQMTDEEYMDEYNNPGEFDFDDSYYDDSFYDDSYNDSLDEGDYYDESGFDDSMTYDEGFTPADEFDFSEFENSAPEEAGE